MKHKAWELLNIFWVRQLYGLADPIRGNWRALEIILTHQSNNTEGAKFRPYQKPVNADLFRWVPSISAGMAVGKVDKYRSFVRSRKGFFLSWSS